jgi:ornithine--oxo-acid transaminase
MVSAAPEVHGSFENQTTASFEEQYVSGVNPHWVRLLKLMQMNVQYERCSGAELFTTTGTKILDCLSGYCVHNLGHNHPAIIEAIKDELDRMGPAMLQSHVPERAGELATRLCRLAGGDLKKAFFCSSGSEGVESAIKFSRVFTGRTGMLYTQGAFHGLTCGALSLMGDPFWKKGFGPMLSDTEEISFGDEAALAEKLKTKKFAAFIVEPMQGEGGIRVPSDSYLKRARELCSRYGTLLVFDEVQTGFYRTGKFLAAHHFGVNADIVILAKALSGGLIPSGAVLMTDKINHAVYGSLKKSLIHTSTYSENGLAMRVGLAVLDTLEKENAGPRTEEMGNYLRAQLREQLADFDMVDEIRGAGLFSGVAFKAPRKLTLRASYEAFMAIHPAMFGQVLVMRLFNDYGILTQICGNNFTVLKVAPPLIVTRAQIDKCVAAIRSGVEMANTPSAFWSDALGLARRAVNI